MDEDKMETAETVEDVEMVNDEDEIEDDDEEQEKVFLPGTRELEKDEELVCDNSAYVMLHQASTGKLSPFSLLFYKFYMPNFSGAPCLSFDIIPDHLGDSRDKYPLTGYVVAGTQAAKTHVNR
jgi:ribosome assembly protein RRB1